MKYLIVLIAHQQKPQPVRFVNPTSQPRKPQLVSSVFVRHLSKLMKMVNALVFRVLDLTLKLAVLNVILIIAKFVEIQIVQLVKNVSLLLN